VIVKRGDTLARIASIAMGSPAKWSAIYQANRAQIRNPSVIHPGQVLVIPRR
jgi:nucleoid-associated protein YgaU